MREIKFQNIAGIILIPAKANSQDGWFAFDTGAMQTVLNNNYFPELTGEKRDVAVFDSEMSVTGAAETYLQELVIDAIPADNSQPVLLMDMSYVETELRTLQPDVRFLGSLGTDIFKNVPILLDYEHSTLTIEPNINTDGAESIPISNEALPVITIELGGGEPHRFVLDTGANTCLLSSELSEKITVSPSPDSSDIVLIPEVKVGTHRYTDISAVFTDISHIRCRVDADGVIGYHILSPQLSLLDFQKSVLYLF